MSKSLYDAKIRTTLKEVVVYKHRTGTFIDFADCRTEYHARDLTPLIPRKK